jgi:hypothetical protein
MVGDPDKGRKEPGTVGALYEWRLSPSGASSVLGLDAGYFIEMATIGPGAFCQACREVAAHRCNPHGDVFLVGTVSLRWCFAFD